MQSISTDAADSTIELEPGQHPLRRRVLEKVKNERLLDTIQQVRTKLDEPMIMGYSSAGVVLACGLGVQELKPGDRVASNRPHAEMVSVPRNLCARVPEGVPIEQAAFAVLGSIAMQGVRLAECRLGETVLVIGLGLIGQLTVALLKAAGVRVIGAEGRQGREGLWGLVRQWLKHGLAFSFSPSP